MGVKVASGNSVGGVGFLGLLAIVFITLKLMGYITWSWWWVTAPLWGGLAFVLVMLVVFLVMLVVFLVLDAIINRG